MKKFFVFLLCFAIFGCAPKTKTKTISFPGTNKIVVTYAPKADFKAKDVKKVEIVDTKKVKVWLDVIAKIPYNGPGILAKLAGDAPEHTIGFYKDKQKLGSLRMKGHSLDAPGKEGYDFYRGEDKELVSLVEKLFK